MLVPGTKTGASIWFVLWGRKETHLVMEIWKTSRGLKGWVTDHSMLDVPVIRMGRIEITADGPVQEENWETREDFLNWYFKR